MKIAAPQNATQIHRKRMSVRFQSSAGSACFDSPHCRTAETPSIDMSTIAAPRIMPSATMKPILRNGAFASSQPFARSHGVSHTPMAPTTIAGTPMRAPTIMPAPTVDAE